MTRARLTVTASLVAVCCLVQGCSGVFDLFVPRVAMQEVIKTFTDSKVYYVYNGTVNKYALRFKIPIPMHVSKLHFCWINKAQREMPYSIGFSVSNKMAMRTPHLNISSQGLVPQTVSGFEVSLPCTGVARTEVSFDIQINVTMQPSNVTTLNIYRKKLCSQGSGDGEMTDSRGEPSDEIPRKPVIVGGGGARSQRPPPATVPQPPPQPQQPPALSTRALAIFLGATAASILLIAALVIVYFWRAKAAYSGAKSSAPLQHQQQQQQQQLQQHMQHLHRQQPHHSQQHLQHLQQHHRQTVPHQQRNGGGRGLAMTYHSVATGLVAETGSVASGYTSCSLPSHQMAGGSPTTERRPVTDPRDAMLEVQIPWDRITLKCILMEGSYGRLYRGSMTSAAGGGSGCETAQEVLIKTVTEASRKDEIAALVQCGSLLAGLQHQNLNPLIAATQIPGDSRPHLVFPYPAEGNLKLYLIRCRNAQSQSAYCVLSTQQLIHMAVQIVKGLAHLHRRRIAHKDLACRNCVLTSDYTVKICDAALAKDLFPEDYQCIGGSDGDEPRPVKWLSTEALAEGKFSTASDVWALGVTLWELITRCLQPYQQTEPPDMPQYLRDGHRLSKPMNCPDQLFSIMASCWQGDPDNRPLLTNLQTALAQFHDTLSAYV